MAADGRSARVVERDVTAEGPRALLPALSAALYELFHSGHAHDPAARPGERDLPLESALTAAVPHRHTAALVPVYEKGEREWIVDLLDVRVRVPAQRVAEARDDGLAVIQADAVRPALSPGFFLCDGSAGSVLGGGPILRLYVHLAGPAFTPDAWRIALGVLEGRRVPYRAKAFSRSSGYPRRDAMVIYLEEAGWPVLRELIAALSVLPGLVDDVSAYARRVGPGLAVAWDPMDDRTGMRLLSFGEHRSRVLAEGLVLSATEGVPVTAAVLACLARGGIDPAAPYRNLSSPDLPLES
ncbi:hypothetical protein SAMN05421869_116224 [Nonomuraea jiangxiensis]|uniref:Uncharacterized protein n=2 Tax=Nonomuraea jiangxiensis TaxID=633440 RepID=A0A1G9CP97_9ACTN|nr:hypothetical protein SAMN05421869_116224 [Nonomuraea jiangxiensis]